MYAASDFGSKSRAGTTEARQDAAVRNIEIEFLDAIRSRNRH
jgi:hypothetical protein